MIGTVKQRVDEEIKEVKAKTSAWTGIKRLSFGINTFRQFMGSGGVCLIDYGEKDLKYNGIPVHVVKNRANYFRIIATLPKKDIEFDSKYNIQFKQTFSNHYFNLSALSASSSFYIPAFKKSIGHKTLNEINDGTFDPYNTRVKIARDDYFKSAFYQYTIDSIRKSGTTGTQSTDQDKRDAKNGALGSLLPNVRTTGQVGATGNTNAE